MTALRKSSKGTAGLTVKTLIDTLQKEGEPQKVIAERTGSTQRGLCILLESWLEGKRVPGRGAEGAGMMAAWAGLSSEAHSRTWWGFTRSGPGATASRKCHIPHVNPLLKQGQHQRVSPRKHSVPQRIPCKPVGDTVLCGDV